MEGRGRKKLRSYLEKDLLEVLEKTFLFLFWEGMEDAPSRNWGLTHAVKVLYFLAMRPIRKELNREQRDSTEDRGLPGTGPTWVDPWQLIWSSKPARSDTRVQNYEYILNTIRCGPNYPPTPPHPKKNERS